MGRPKACNPCCNAIPCTTCEDDEAPAQWQVTLSGITAGSCTVYCSRFNRTWTLEFLGNLSGACVWRETLGDAPDCFSAANIVQLQISATSIQLFLGPSAFFGAQYSKSITNPNCFDSHVLTRVANPGTCGSWPATVTIVPVT